MTFENRVFNFAPGPATLPRELLQTAAKDILNWQGLGAGVMEVSHRGAPFMECYRRAVSNLRLLMNISDEYEVLFMQGGAIGENAAIPMNLMNFGKKGPQADFVLTGIWTQKSIKEAGKYGNARCAATSEATNFTSIPDPSTWDLSQDSAYVHICANETVGGVEFQDVPDTGSLPLVADISSNILSREMDVSKFGLLFAGAQKNIGPAGLTIVIVRKELIGNALPITPTVWDFKIQAANDSMINTPPTFAIYFSGLVFEWLLAQGGVKAIEQQNIQKAQLLYDAIDASSLFENRIDKAYRSRMNATFYLKDEGLNDVFLQGAQQHGMIGLKGHKSVGGMRASIYNAMPIEGVQQLVAYMKEFERRV